jgi:hypothetical protein
MSIRLAAATTATLALTSVAAYLTGWTGAAIPPWPITMIGLVGGCAIAQQLSRRPHEEAAASGWLWGIVVLGITALLVWPVWPAALPPGGASDLTHHLMLVDVLERTRHLVDGAASEAALGEMAHYTPGLHLLTVIAGSLFGVEAHRTAYPLLIVTIALKAGFVFLISYDMLSGRRGRAPLAVAAVGLVLFAPRAYSVEGFLQAGFLAQVASELFAVAGWWGLTRWRLTPSGAWALFVGLTGAAVFLAWPIWIGPLMVTAGIAVLMQPDLTVGTRVRHAAIAALPFALVAVLHLSRHAAWLRMAGTSGSVPALVLGPTVVVLLGLALLGCAAAWTRGAGQITLCFAVGVVLQAAALYVLARVRGAETPYMAMKMIYLAVFPAAVLAAAGLGAVLGRVPGRSAACAWVATLVVLGLGLRAATASPVPPPVVSADLDAAGRWARVNLPAECVDYLVRDAEQAYWLHLAVMGQPRSSTRTADIDGYTANRAVGRWIEGTALPYAVALRELLPGEVLDTVEVVRSFGAAVIIRRRGSGC